MNKLLIFFGSFGLLGSAIFGYTFWPLYDYILKEQLILTNDSYSYSMWSELPDDLEMYMRVYYFNVTNAEDIMNNNTVTPILEEIGPYVYRERHYKDVIQWNDNDTITYQQRKRWEFIEEESPYSLDEIISNINIIALSAGEYARWNPDVFYTVMIDELMKMEDIPAFLTYPVRNWTFDGIFEELLEFGQNAPDYGLELPIPFDKFGWFYSRNDSADYDGTFSMYTGADTLANIGQISEWNYLNSINESVYPLPCGALSGSAGEFFPPGRDETYVDFFSPDLCRTIRFEYDKETTVSGALGYRYKLGEKFINNETYNSENSCFNPEPVSVQPLINGLLNVSSCKFQAPAYVSYPHFYLADPILLDQFEKGSLNPDVNKHESYLSLEPRSGIPLEVSVRMQINGLVRPLVKPHKLNDTKYDPRLSLFDDFKPTFYPMIWFETSTKISGSTSTGIMIVLLSRMNQIVYSIGGVTLFISLVLIGLGFVRNSGSKLSL